MKLFPSLVITLVLASLASLHADDAPKTKKAAKRGKLADASVLAKNIGTTFPDFVHAPNVVYKMVGDQALQLDILTPKDLKAGAAPALVYILGGG